MGTMIFNDKQWYSINDVRKVYTCIYTMGTIFNDMQCYAIICNDIQWYTMIFNDKWIAMSR